SRSRSATDRGPTEGLLVLARGALARAAVPERRRVARCGSLPFEPLGNLQQPFRLEAEEFIRTMRDRHGTLRVVAQGEARDTEHGRFLLYASRVGRDRRCGELQRDEVEVWKRLNDLHRLRRREPEVAHP